MQESYLVRCPGHRCNSAMQNTSELHPECPSYVKLFEGVDDNVKLYIVH